MSSPLLAAPMRPIYAVFIYLGFVISTLIGYLIYEIIAHDISGQLLTLSTFVHLCVFTLFTTKEPEDFVNWRPAIGKYVLWYAMFFFAYWYCFWVGITSDKNADLALAILALVIVASVICERRILGPDADEDGPQDIPKEFWITSLMLLAGVLLLKLNLDVTAFSGGLQHLRDAIVDRIVKLNWYPVGCLFLAVLAEAGYEVVLSKLKRDIRAENSTLYQDVVLTAEEEKDKSDAEKREALKHKKLNVAAGELNVAALLPCLFLAVLLWILHSPSGGSILSLKLDGSSLIRSWLTLLGLGLALTSYINFVREAGGKRSFFPFRAPAPRQIVKVLLVASVLATLFEVLKANAVLGWFWLWLALLTLVGTAYRNNVLTPLRMRRGLPLEGLGPWQAVRVVIYWGASILVLAFLEGCVIRAEHCVGALCNVRLPGLDHEPFLINTNFIPQPRLSYYLGAVLIVLAFMLRFRETWARLSAAWRVRRSADSRVNATP